VLGYSKHRFPLWYHEGFAEFMSGTRFREKGAEFTLGESPGRTRAPARLVAWDELIDGDFDLHAIRSPEVLSNAYLQAWLLVHYLTVGDELAHTDDLNKYLALFAQGSPSHDAFAAAFGISPDEMGSILISSYGRRIPFYSIAFRSGVQDHDFIRSTADGGAIRETIQQMTDEFSLSAK
jgi:hypothetical protein